MNKPQLQALSSDELKARQEVREAQMEVTHEDTLEFVNIKAELRFRCELLLEVKSGGYIKTIQAMSTPQLEAIHNDYESRVQGEEVVQEEHNLFAALRIELAKRRAIRRMSDDALRKYFKDTAKKAFGNPTDKILIREYTEIFKECARRKILTDD